MTAVGENAPPLDGRGEAPDLKHQFSNSKLQRNPKWQIPSGPVVWLALILEFGTSLVFGAWHLEFLFVSRILKVYEGRFRALLGQLNARRGEQGTRWLVTRANQLSERISPTRSLAQVHERLQQQVEAFASRLGRSQQAGRSALSTVQGSPDGFASPRPFLCDAGLGGLARWLRAAGYDTVWVPDIDDAELVRQAQRRRAIILTTDSLLMERGVLRDGVVLAFWLPPRYSGSSTSSSATLAAPNAPANCGAWTKNRRANGYPREPRAGWTNTSSACAANSCSGAEHIGEGSARSYRSLRNEMGPSAAARWNLRLADV